MRLRHVVCRQVLTGQRSSDLQAAQRSGLPACAPLLCANSSERARVCMYVSVVWPWVLCKEIARRRNPCLNCVLHCMRAADELLQAQPWRAPCSAVALRKCLHARNRYLGAAAECGGAALRSGHAVSVEAMCTKIASG